MTNYDDIENLARKGAHNIVDLCRAEYADLLARKGAQSSLSFPDTVYELPCHYALTPDSIKTLGDAHALELAPDADLAQMGQAVLLSAELILALKSSSGDPVAHIPDKVIRELGYKLVDGTIPGILLLLGSADDPKALVALARDAQSRGLLTFLSGPLIAQLEAEGVALGLETMLVPLHPTLLGAALAGSVAIRAGLIFGGIGRGERGSMIHYLAERLPAVAIHLGDVNETTAAVAAAAWLLAIPIVSDRQLGDIEFKLHSLQPGENPITIACEMRGIKARIEKVDIPIPFGSAFEGERVRKPDLAIEIGNNITPSFELLTMAPLSDVEDGKITVHGADIDTLTEGGTTPLGIVIRVGGRKMQEDFATVIERRLHDWFNRAMGVMHVGQRDVNWIRISKGAKQAGFVLRHLGVIAHACIHADFGAIVDRVQVDIYTAEADVLREREKAREFYRARDARLAGLTDEAAEMFYSCLLCQSFAPNHVCIVTPERTGLCGSVSWLDARASHELAPLGACTPVLRGTVLDEQKGDFSGVNDYVRKASHGALEGCTLYSLLDRPMTSCGCFEIAMVLVPEANGVLVIGRDDVVDTPLGMGFTTLAGTIGGGAQVPGFMGIAKRYIISRKFLRAEGGIARLVWLSSALKEALRSELERRAEEQGLAGFVDKIATENEATDLDSLQAWLEKVGHPALRMDALI